MSRDERAESVSFSSSCSGLLRRRRSRQLWAQERSLVLAVPSRFSWRRDARRRARNEAKQRVCRMLMTRPRRIAAATIGIAALVLRRLSSSSAVPC